MSILIPLLAAIVGFVLLLLATRAALLELAKAMLWCGILVTLLYVAGQTLEFLGKGGR